LLGDNIVLAQGQSGTSTSTKLMGF
jgi:hypothetical protein